MLTAVYIRVSTQEQAEHGYSIDEQTERMKLYCSAMNWTIYRIYTDAGYSGSNTDRPGLQELVKDVRAHRVQRVLVYKLDRLSRSQKDTLELIEDVFLQNGVDFVSMSENFDTGTPLGRAMIGILAVFAQLEREQIKERMHMGLSARAKQGKFHGSARPPIGYDYIGGSLVPNTAERIAVQKVFQMYAAGAKVIDIADALNAEGLLHKYGLWSDQTVSNIIGKRSRTYIGQTFWKGEWYPGEHEPIIPKDLHDTVSDMYTRAKAQRTAFNRRPAKASSYLGGLIFCARCGAKYTVQQVNGRYKDHEYHRRYYTCTTHGGKHASALPERKRCDNKMWRMEKLDEMIFAEIRKIRFEKPVEASNTHENTSANKIPIEKEITALNGKIQRLMDLYAVGDMPIEMISERIKALQAQKTALTDQLEALQDVHKLTQDQAAELIDSFDPVLDGGSFADIRAVLEALIDKIEIDGDDVTIFWAFE